MEKFRDKGVLEMNDIPEVENANMDESPVSTQEMAQEDMYMKEALKEAEINVESKPIEKGLDGKAFLTKEDIQRRREEESRLIEKIKSEMKRPLENTDGNGGNSNENVIEKSESDGNGVNHNKEGMGVTKETRNEYKPCEACKGSGRKWFFFPCFTCGGTGSFKTAESSKTHVNRTKESMNKGGGNE